MSSKLEQVVAGVQEFIRRGIPYDAALYRISKDWHLTDVEIKEVQKLFLGTDHE